MALFVKRIQLRRTGRRDLSLGKM